MNVRRSSFPLVVLVGVVAVGAGCATSGSQSGGFGGDFDDCANLYPPVTSGYGYNQYYPSDFEEGPCSAYPRVAGYYPEYVVQKPAREVTTVEGREHRGVVVTRGDSNGRGSWSGSGYSDSSSSSYSGSSGGTSVPRMEPIPVGSSPSGQAPSGAGGTVTVAPREH